METMPFAALVQGISLFDTIEFAILLTNSLEKGNSPVLEKKGILGESLAPGRRPGDVTIPLWCEGKGLCVDVAVVSPCLREFS